MKKIKWQLILDKVGTVVVDRRFWVALFTIGSVIFGVPELANGADGLSQQATDWVVIISQIVALVAIPLGLTVSWANRPPSGLGYKKTSTETDELVKTLSELVNKE